MKLAILGLAGLLSAGCQRRPTVTWQPGSPESVLIVTGIQQIGEPTIRVEGDHAVYRLPLPGRPPSLAGPLPKVAGGWVRAEADSVELALPWRHAARAELADGVARLIVTTEGQARRETPIDAGATLLTIEQSRADGPTRVFALRLAADQAYRLRLSTAGRAMRARATVPEMAKGHTAALNGGFFDPETGSPLGALQLDGEWVSQPLHDRACLLLAADKPPRIEPVTWLAEVQTPLLKLPVETVNHTPSDEAECAVTNDWWDGVDLFPGWRRTPLGKSVIRHRQPLDAAPTLVWHTEPPSTGNVLGGGPRLLREGQVVVDESVAAEKFKTDVRDTVTARAGVGLLPDGGVVLAFGEGRRPYSRGFALGAWAEVFRELGCVEALNLDGSSSATLVVNDKVQGRPWAGKPSPVANALVVTAP